MSLLLGTTPAVLVRWRCKDKYNVRNAERGRLFIFAESEEEDKKSEIEDKNECHSAGFKVK